VIAAIVSPIYKACNIVMTALQSPLLDIAQQRTEIRNLILNLGDNFDIKMTATDASYTDLAPGTFVVEDHFWMNSAAVRELIEDQVSFCFVILISWFSSIHTGIMGSQYICIVFGL